MLSLILALLYIHKQPRLLFFLKLYIRALFKISTVGEKFSHKNHSSSHLPIMRTFVARKLSLKPQSAKDKAFQRRLDFTNGRQWKRFERVIEPLNGLIAFKNVEEKHRWSDSL